MEFSQSNDLFDWRLLTPLIGGIILYIGLNIRIVSIDDDD